jgi:hypothetical protein
MITRSKRRITLRSKNLNNIQKHKHKEEIRRPIKHIESNSLNKTKSTFIDEKGIVRNFVYPGSKDSNFWQMSQDRTSNRCFYGEKQSLTSIPFVLDIPEGMPCFIRCIGDIINLTENQVDIFLKGYSHDIKGPLDMKKFELAEILGIPSAVARKTFNYDPAWIKLKYGKQMKWIDENGIIRNFIYRGHTEHFNLWQMERDRTSNRCSYGEKQSLTPIPFVLDIPEGMPCFIRCIGDIINLTEVQVNIFLKGYSCSTKGSLDRKKYRLAKTLGVPSDVAKKTFIMTHYGQS